MKTWTVPKKKGKDGCGEGAQGRTMEGKEEIDKEIP